VLASAASKAMANLHDCIGSNIKHCYLCEELEVDKIIFLLEREVKDLNMFCTTHAVNKY